MPIEYLILRDRPSPINQCPKCGAVPFEPFLRGMVCNHWRKWFGRPSWALICAECKEIVGHEDARIRPPARTVRDVLAFRMGTFRTTTTTGNPTERQEQK